jgi:hypothetical protein
MIFRSDGQNMMIMTQVCTEIKKIQRIIVHDFRPKTKWLKWLPGQKFFSFGNKTLNTGKIKCFDAALKVSFVRDYYVV